MKRCIVVADDDPTILYLVALRLGQARFNVVRAADGRDALAQIQRRAPVACILDVQMPHRSGLEVLDAIRADPAISRLPVMILTGERDAATVLQAMSGGADDYMVKPFHPDRLLERVTRMVAKAEAMQAVCEL